MAWIRAFVAFWVDFVLGDDWTVAAVIAVALLGTWGLVEAGVTAWWLLPVAVVGATVRSLHNRPFRMTSVSTGRFRQTHGQSPRVLMVGAAESPP